MKIDGQVCAIGVRQGAEFVRLVSVVQQTFACRTAGFPKSAKVVSRLDVVDRLQTAQMRSVAVALTCFRYGPQETSVPARTIMHTTNKNGGFIESIAYRKYAFHTIFDSTDQWFDQ